jgi:hypothetical protein
MAGPKHNNSPIGIEKILQNLSIECGEVSLTAWGM